MDAFNRLNQLNQDLLDIQATIKDFEKTQYAIKSEIELLEREAVETLLNEKSQGSQGRIVGNVVYGVMKVNPKPIVTDESKIPDKFWKVTKSIKKAELNQAVKDGEVIEGVTLDNGGYTLTRKANLKG